ncbi:MAG: DsrE/DsrF/DrsH-like family protein [Planctomycetes bacterium]|nr:DsrE/DsrF/DrsH-like family protein [Planctomycetota bacterium]
MTAPVASEPETGELRELAARIAELEARIAAAEPTRAVSIVCFSGEWDRLFAAFTVANGALAMGYEVHLFLTFWAAAALRDPRAEPSRRRSVVERGIAAMLPGGPRRARLSRLHWFGLGKRFFAWRMRRRGVPALEELIESAREQGVKIHICETTVDLLGMVPAEFGPLGEVDCCGVTTFLRDATRGQLALFV